jgi:very-short-patch-repair endonuclease
VKDDAALIVAAAANHDLITTQQIMALGVSGERWRRLQDAGLWLQVTPGHFRHAATPLSFEMQIRAGAGWLGPSSALFGSTALHWLGVDVPLPTRAEFLLPRSSRYVAHWMHVRTSRRWDRGDVVHHRGLRTSTGTRAVIDYATVERSAAAIEHAIDSSIRLRRTALPQLRRRMAALNGRGRTGSTLLRELLLDSGGESYLERRFLQLTRLSGFPRPRCQIVCKGTTEKVIRVDFVFSDRVVVEVSGRLGHSTDADRRKDAHRRNALTQSGFEVLEFTTVDVIDNPDYVVETLGRSIRRSR